MYIGQKVKLRERIEDSVFEYNQIYTILEIKHKVCNCEADNGQLLVKVNEPSTYGKNTCCNKCKELTDGPYFHSSLFKPVFINSNIRVI